MAVLVGKKSPVFQADAVVNGGEFVENFSLQKGVLMISCLLYFMIPFSFNKIHTILHMNQNFCV